MILLWFNKLTWSHVYDFLLCPSPNWFCSSWNYSSRVFEPEAGLQYEKKIHLCEKHPVDLWWKLISNQPHIMQVLKPLGYKKMPASPNADMNWKTCPTKTHLVKLWHLLEWSRNHHKLQICPTTTHLVKLCNSWNEAGIIMTHLNHDWTSVTWIPGTLTSIQSNTHASPTTWVTKWQDRLK